MYVDEYLPHIGQAGPRIEQIITAESIRRFAEAVGETDLLYYDPEYAASTPYGGIIAPPTYSFTLRYPEIPHIWIAPKGRIHAGQSISYRRPLYAGETVFCGQTLANAYEKQGKQGWMVFLEHERTVYDRAGAVICVNKMTTITKESLFLARGQQQNPLPPEEAAVPAPSAPRAFAVGDVLPPVTLPPVIRLDIIKYAGAAWDYNAIHLFDADAQKLGFPSVIAHGMFSVALQGKVLRVWLGKCYSVTQINVRFRAPLLPGDSLTCSGKVTGVSEDRKQIQLTLQASNNHGAEVISGEATMELAVRAPSG